MGKSKRQRKFCSKFLQFPESNKRFTKGIFATHHCCNGDNNANTQFSSARAIAYCLGVPLLEIIIQRKPVIKNPRLEWNNSGEWGMNPLFNKHFIPTNEFHLRLATVLARAINKLDNICIPKNMSTVETLDIGELWT